MESVYGNTLDVFGKTLLDLARFEVGQCYQDLCME
jgi:hypothetical protein